MRTDIPADGRRGSAVALALTILLHLAALVAVAIQWRGSYAPPPPAAHLAITQFPLASPPEPQKADKDKPHPEQEKQAKPVPPTIEPIQTAITPLAPPISAPVAPDPPKSDPAPQQAETAAPKAIPAPPAPRVASNAPESWEGRMLARLEKFRRYPTGARNARQQGVAYVRFRIDRDGHVLSSALVRSSGFPMLDQAALETLRRADPLPKIPDDRPDEIEISVPVEFYIR